jgi:hypothetical protein
MFYVIHITEWIITRFPLELEEHLYFRRIGHHPRERVDGIDRDIRFDLERKIESRITIRDIR